MTIGSISKVNESLAGVAKAGASQKPLSRMNKSELIAYATRLGLSTEGTVPELRKRIKDAQTD